jgi:hypothetical protein
MCYYLILNVEECPVEDTDSFLRRRMFAVQKITLDFLRGNRVPIDDTCDAAWIITQKIVPKLPKREAGNFTESLIEVEEDVVFSVLADQYLYLH